MKRRALGLAAGAAALIVLTLALVGFPGLAREKSPPAPAPAVSPDSSAEAPRATPAPPSPSRDLFVFKDERQADEASAGTSAWTPAERAPAASPSPTPAAPVRLVGFVRSQGQVTAVLAIDATIELAKVGDEVRGYRVLSFDPDLAQARLRAPDGQELDLAAPQS